MTKEFKRSVRAVVQFLINQINSMDPGQLLVQNLESTVNRDTKVSQQLIKSFVTANSVGNRISVSSL